MRKPRASLVIHLTILCLLSAALAEFGMPIHGQRTVSDFDRERGRIMLNEIKGDLQKKITNSSGSRCQTRSGFVIRASLAGASVTPEEAGMMFPIEWRKQ